MNVPAEFNSVNNEMNTTQMLKMAMKYMKDVQIAKFSKIKFASTDISIFFTLTFLVSMVYVWWNTDYVLYAVAIFGILMNIVLSTAHVASIFYAFFKLNKKPKLSPEEDGRTYPPISILKPCKGVDAHLEQNLETYFHLNYPKYEVLFCVHTAQDKAIEIMERLIKKYPKVDARIIIGRGNIGVNPKINNMVYGYEVMKYNHFWICDARITAMPETLTELMNHMTEKVALVHAMPFVTQRAGFAGTLEKAYFGGHHAVQYICAQMLGITCMTGMSNLIRKDVIENHIGGLKNLSQYIAEDYFMAKYILDNGWKIAVCSLPARQNLGNPTVPAFLDRMVRWKKLHIAMVPLVVLLEPLLEWEVSGAFLAFSCYYLYGWNAIAVFLYHILIWFLCDYILLRAIENQKLGVGKCDFFLAWLFRALITPYIIFTAAKSPYINWMGRKFKINWGGSGEEIFENGKN